MLQLAYISTSRAVIDEPLLTDILAVSRRNNRTAGITGLLVAGGRRFLQALEGPPADVMAAYTRIEADPRHFALVLLSSRKVDSRSFGDWSMSYQHAGIVPTTTRNLEREVAALTATIDDPNLRAQFTGFARLHSQAA